MIDFNYQDWHEATYQNCDDPTEHDEEEKFECDDCGCYYYVDDRDDFDCPNCEDMEQTERCIKNADNPQKNIDELRSSHTNTGKPKTD